MSSDHRSHEENRYLPLQCAAHGARQCTADACVRRVGTTCLRICSRALTSIPNSHTSHRLSASLRVYLRVCTCKYVPPGKCLWLLYVSDIAKAEKAGWLLPIIFIPFTTTPKKGPRGNPLSARYSKRCAAGLQQTSSLQTTRSAAGRTPQLGIWQSEAAFMARKTTSEDDAKSSKRGNMTGD